VETSVSLAHPTKKTQETNNLGMLNETTAGEETTLLAQRFVNVCVEKKIISPPTILDSPMDVYKQQQCRKWTRILKHQTSPPPAYIARHARALRTRCGWSEQDVLRFVQYCGYKTEKRPTTSSSKKHGVTWFLLVSDSWNADGSYDHEELF